MEATRSTVTFKGNPLTLVGELPRVGAPAPDFQVLANDLSPVKLSDLGGKTRVICSVPSLDTAVCDTEVRTFNKHATSLGDDVVVLAISMDLPFAQQRWCGAAGVKNVRTLSDHRDAQFGKAYGVLIKELRLLARAVFVVDKKGVIRYIQVVDEMTNEPDYDAALQAVRDAQ
jgi:thiol peroxidase